MTSILERVHAYKGEEVREARAAVPEAELARRARDTDPPRGFRSAIDSALARGDRALIAEIKKASPSKGMIRTDFDPAALACAYADGGATCLSVLTDTPSFGGAPEHLTTARETSGLPVLRKDFMIDPYQVLQARAWGADCVLVILALVDDAVAREIQGAAQDHDMDVVIEVHDDDELARAVALGASIVGINNRDLLTFETTLATSERLAPRVPPGAIVIGESGISTPADLDRLAAAGIRTFLVGESLMRQPDVTAATRTLLGLPSQVAASAPIQAGDRSRQ